MGNPCSCIARVLTRTPYAYPDLIVKMALAKQLTPGPKSATYTITVRNDGDATAGDGLVTEHPPVGLTIVSMTGLVWNCTGLTCITNQVVGVHAQYTPITVIADVAATAHSDQRCNSLGRWGDLHNE